MSPCLHLSVTPFLKGGLNRARMQGHINTWGHHPVQLHALIQPWIFAIFTTESSMMTELVWKHGGVTGGGVDFSKRLSHGLTRHSQTSSMKLTLE